MQKISISIDRFLEQFNKEYAFLYDNRDRVAVYDEAVNAFDMFILDEQHAAFVGEFAKYRKDLITSDREAAAFMFALDALVA